mmetsp:Transcript_41129/g.86278  ORF Transcript_41129/g.86278 Transcript_41129/m.86278 type:complete len:92 (-) Transcript_41129:71-346(-)
MGIIGNCGNCGDGDVGGGDVGGVDDNDDDDSARCQGWPHELEHRLKKFEEESDLLVKAMYRGKGWMHSSDYEHLAKEDDGFFSDSDSDEDQ